MNNMVDIRKIQELSEEATKGPWEDLYELGDDMFKGPANIRSDDDGVVVSNWVQSGKDADFVVTIVNSWPEIYKELLASRALVESVKGMEVEDSIHAAFIPPPIAHMWNSCSKVWRSQRDTALKTYAEVIKQV